MEDATFKELYDATTTCFPLLLISVPDEFKAKEKREEILQLKKTLVRYSMLQIALK